MPTFYWVFEYQPIASKILTLPSRYKRAKKQFASTRKRSPLLGPGSCLGYTHPYLYIYCCTLHSHLHGFSAFLRLVAVPMGLVSRSQGLTGHMLIDNPLLYILFSKHIPNPGRGKKTVKSGREWAIAIKLIYPSKSISY